MRIVNEILLKIWDKLKKSIFEKGFLNLENKLVENYRQVNVHCWKYETY